MHDKHSEMYGEHKFAYGISRTSSHYAACVSSARMYHVALSRSMDTLQSIRNCIPAWVQHHPRGPRRCCAFSCYGNPSPLHFRSGSFQAAGLDHPTGSRLVDVCPYRAGIQALPHPDGGSAAFGHGGAQSVLPALARAGARGPSGPEELPRVGSIAAEQALRKFQVRLPA